MSGANNQFDGLGGSIRSLLAKLGLLYGRDERGEDLLENPEHSEIEFSVLSPVSGTPTLLRSFTLLSGTWVRRHCEPFALDRALQLVDQQKVRFTSGTQAALKGDVEDGDLFSVNIEIKTECLVATCSCEQARRAVSLAPESLPCEHCAALLLYIIAERLIPLSAPADIISLCPITRLPLNAHHVIYRCERCMLSFSPEGWEFLRKMDRGKCCGCHSRNTIKARPADLEK